ncbi:MAG: DUF4221 family protein [Cyclobacteriaceae bacterium]
MHHFSYLILILLLSCEGKTNINGLDYFSNLKFSFDTVMIDPGDGIIFLKYQLLNADLGKDGKYIFNFNENDHTLEKINLDELRLEEKLPFEKEGPNGTGTGGVSMRVHNENQITMTDFDHTALFSLGGEKLMTIYFENFSIGVAGTNGGELLRSNTVIDTDANRLYVLIYRYKNEKYALGILYLEEFEVARLELKSFEEVSNYSFIYSNSRGNIIVNAPEVNIEKFDKIVILSNEITSTLMWYDIEMDSLFFKSYNSQLAANQKEKDYIKKHETVEEFKAEYRIFKQEINFLPPFWDQQGECFYRFSYQEIENTDGDRIRSKVYLTALDKDLNILGEVLVPQLNKKPGKHFAKDGKIWIYENMNDEMGFVRLGMEKIQ